MYIVSAYNQRPNGYQCKDTSVKSVRFMVKVTLSENYKDMESSYLLKKMGFSKKREREDLEKCVCAQSSADTIPKYDYSGGNKQFEL